MGRGTKRKNAGVGVDFRKVKHKVGKKLPRAQNETDTTFKSRAISLPEQSVAADKTGAATTSRNLTLKDVLAQCGHYSERVRRDALQGLSELLTSHLEELRRHATLVMEAASERITDGDKAVRTALQELLSTQLLPGLGRGGVAPFVPLLMAHVCAALTHLAPPVREDALGFLETLMEWRPDLVAGAFLGPVLHHFCDLLSRGSRGQSLKAGSLGSLLRVVAALERVLSRAVGALEAAAGGAARSAPGGAGGVGAGLTASWARPAASIYAQHSAAAGAAAAGAGVGAAGGVGPWEADSRPLVLLRQRCEWAPPPAAAALAELPPLCMLGSAAARAGAAAQAAGGSVAAAAAAAGAAAAAAAAAGAGLAGGAGEEAAARALLSHLLECWSECGPGQLAQTPDLAAAQCLTATLRCCDLLLRHWGVATLAGSPSARGQTAASLLGRVAPHFPVQRPGVKPPAGVEEQLVLLNVAAAQLLARFLPEPAPPPQQQQQRQQGAAAPLAPAAAGAVAAGQWGAGGSGGGVEEPEWVGRLLGWFGSVMAEGAALPASDDVLLADTEPPATAAAAEPGPAAPRSKGKGRGRPQQQQQQQQSSGGGGGSRSSVGSLPGEVYGAALEGALRALPLLPGPRRAQLLGAAAALWARAPVRSAARLQVLAFWRRLLADPTAAFYAPCAAGDGLPLLRPEQAAAWLQSLPRFLYELGPASPPASEAALRLLLDALRYAPPGSPLEAALGGLQPQLAPLFATLVAAPSPRKQQQQQEKQQQQQQQQQEEEEQQQQQQQQQQQEAAPARVHVGPLAKLPAALQELAADVLAHFPAASDQLLRTTGVVCLGPAYPLPTALRLLAAVSSQAARGAADPAAFCSLLLNLLTGGASAAGAQQGEWARHAAVVGAATQGGVGLGDARGLVAALAGPLLTAAAAAAAAEGGAGGSARPLPLAAYGLLQLSLAAAQQLVAEEESAAGEESAAALPAQLAQGLPGVMLQYVAACCTADRAADGTASSTGLPSAAQAAEQCVRLVTALAAQLLPLLLEQLGAPQAALAGDASGARLGAALQLLLAAVGEPQLRGAMLEQQQGLRHALAACSGAADTLGGSTHATAACRTSLEQLTGLCAALFGWELP